jgi:hypothetical protein
MSASQSIHAKRPMTISVPEAGWKYFGLSRNSSYQAAKRGDIPTIAVGNRFRVPIAAMERILKAAASKERGSGSAVVDARA